MVIESIEETADMTPGASELRQIEHVANLLASSENYNYILKRHLVYLGETRNAKIYSVLLKEHQDLRILIPKKTNESFSHTGEDLVFETQLQKVIFSEGLVQELKEEIIRITALEHKLNGYCAIFSVTQNTLEDLIGSNFINNGKWRN